MGSNPIRQAKQARGIVGGPVLYAPGVNGTGLVTFTIYLTWSDNSAIYDSNAALAQLVEQRTSNA